MVKNQTSRRRDRGRHKNANRKKIEQGPPCPTCSEITVEAAEYCHHCGTSLTVTSSREAGRKQKLVVVILFSFLSIISVTAAFFIVGPGLKVFSNTTARVTPSPNSEPKAVSSDRRSGQPPNLSTMSPREAADRLFNRVMAASERGNKAEAEQFAPVAIEAYKRVGKLDADGLFHLGEIYLVLKDYKNVTVQAQRIKRLIPEHLLAAYLEYQVATLTGDKHTKDRIAAGFKKNLLKESNIIRPEYSAHQISINQLRQEIIPSGGINSLATISDINTRGKKIFEEKCAVCHGKDAIGTKTGPPLVHKIYEPSHHDNGSFYRAVQNGVQQHHWKFGNMAPLPGVPQEDVSQIISYVRGLQAANGIR